MFISHNVILIHTGHTGKLYNKIALGGRLEKPLHAFAK